MRLIDADACPCNTCRTQCCENPRRCTFFGLWLLRQAYDIEKVMAELKEKKDEASIEAGKRSVRIGEDEYEDDPYYEGKKHAYGDVIELLRKDSV